MIQTTAAASHIKHGVKNNLANPMEDDIFSTLIEVFLPPDADNRAAE